MFDEPVEIKGAGVEERAGVVWPLGCSEGGNGESSSRRLSWSWIPPRVVPPCSNSNTSLCTGSELEPSATQKMRREKRGGKWVELCQQRHGVVKEIFHSIKQYNKKNNRKNYNNATTNINFPYSKLHVPLTSVDDDPAVFSASCQRINVVKCCCAHR